VGDGAELLRADVEEAAAFFGDACRAEVAAKICCAG
jgi:hypothetical protein